METIKFMNHIAYYYPTEKRLQISTNQKSYLIRANLIGAAGLLSLFSFVGKSWEEISSFHIIVVAICIGMTLMISIGYHRTAKYKSSLIFDGKSNHLIKGTQKIPLSRVKSIGTSTIKRIDEENGDISFSYRLLLKFDNKSLFTVYEDSDRYKISLLKEWVKNTL